MIEPQQHAQILQQAIDALHHRTYFSHFPENPSPTIYGDEADKAGRYLFTALHGQQFTELLSGEPEAWVGREESPYTQTLGMKYTYWSPETLLNGAQGHFTNEEKFPAIPGLPSY